MTRFVASVECSIDFGAAPVADSLSNAGAHFVTVTRYDASQPGSHGSPVIALVGLPVTERKSPSDSTTKIPSQHAYGRDTPSDPTRMIWGSVRGDTCMNADAAARIALSASCGRQRLCNCPKLAADRRHQHGAVDDALEVPVGAGLHIGKPRRPVRQFGRERSRDEVRVEHSLRGV